MNIIIANGFGSGDCTLGCETDQPKGAKQEEQIRNFDLRHSHTQYWPAVLQRAHLDKFAKLSAFSSHNCLCSDISGFSKAFTKFPGRDMLVLTGIATGRSGHSVGSLQPRANRALDWNCQCRIGNRQSLVWQCQPGNVSRGLLTTLSDGRANFIPSSQTRNLRFIKHRESR
jgi:hypothetical protein